MHAGPHSNCHAHHQYTFTDVAYKEKCAVPIIEESQKLVIASALAKVPPRTAAATSREREPHQRQHQDCLCPH